MTLNFNLLSPDEFQKETITNKTFTLISAELERARNKFPGAADLTVALMEECGELAQATLKNDRENIIKEAIQVAVVAIRIIEEGDATFKNRKEISQDEKYEYEKIGKEFIYCQLTSCKYENEEYVFILNCKAEFQYKTIRCVSKTKPAYNEFREFMGWINAIYWSISTSIIQYNGPNWSCEVCTF